MFRRGSMTEALFFEICSSAVGIIRDTLNAPAEVARRRAMSLRARTYRVARARRVALYRLRRAGLVDVSAEDAIQLTSKGKALSILHCVEHHRRPLPKGLFCLVFFDIPERHRKERDALRFLLRKLGFCLFQKSVWISTQDAADHLQCFVQISNVERFVKVCTARPAKRYAHFTIVKKVKRATTVRKRQR
ncbi:hypothetical protein HYS28_02120 [Candidatus Uhrbacteria bacterium]|nr:hypothetical protein [Candidatus Uhrbacteria bacterium]